VLRKQAIRFALLLAPFVLGASSSGAPRYSAQQNGEVVELHDSEHQTVVSIIPTVGNIAFSMKVKGHEVLRWPYASVEEFKAKPGLSGIPLLAPWANRLDETAFYANGKRYAFDMELGNVRGAIPSHGFLQTTNQWQVVETKVDARSAWVTSRLDFFSTAGLDQTMALRSRDRMTYGSTVHLLRADGRCHECAEPRPQGVIQRAPKRAARRCVAGKFLGEAEWLHFTGSTPLAFIASAAWVLLRNAMSALPALMLRAFALIAAIITMGR